MRYRRPDDSVFLLPDQVLRPTFAEICLDAVAHNVRAVREKVGPRRGIMAVVKANAYGHGAVEVSRTVLENGADMLGVALVEEGWVLRENGIRCPIVVLGPVFPFQIPMALQADLTLAVFTMEMARALDGEAALRGMRAPVHIKVDTGMGRLGIPERDAITFLESVGRLRNIEIKGIYTHLSCADSPDKAFSNKQIEAFRSLCGEAASRGMHIPLKHVSNSASIVDLPDSFLDLVRPGIMIYGGYPGQRFREELVLWPVMTFKTRVAHIRDLSPGNAVSYGRSFVAKKPTRVAILPVGYADGFPRYLSNRGSVLIRGRRAPVVGMVCMDMTMVDVTHIPGVREQDEAVIFGRQGDATISVEEVARDCETISYEILCGVGRRVPRIYIDREGKEA